MILLTEKTKQDFLSLEWCKKLKEVGVDMDDAKYFIIHRKFGLEDRYYIIDKDTKEQNPASLEPPVPTYTLAELLYKLNEWPGKKTTLTDGSEGYIRDLTFFKDSPFYAFGYNVERKDKDGEIVINMPDEWAAILEYPIDSAATLLLHCIKNNIKYTKDISSK